MDQGHTDGIEADDEWLSKAKELLASDTDGKFLMYLDLPKEKKRLVTAYACLWRIQTLCEALYGGAWVSLRFEGGGDEYVYQAMKKALLQDLNEERYAAISTTACQLLPEILPHGEDCPEEWRLAISPNLNELQAALIKLCVQMDVNPHEPGVDFFFIAYDEAIEKMAAESRRQNQLFEKQHSLLPDHQPKSDQTKGTDSTGRPRTGRRRLKLTYETARHSWWELVSTFEEMDEARKPTQEDLCAFLTANRTQISVRTLRERIQSWRNDGMEWPPPEPIE